MCIATVGFIIPHFSELNRHGRTQSIIYGVVERTPVLWWHFNYFNVGNTNQCSRKYQNELHGYVVNFLENLMEMQFPGRLDAFATS